MEEVVISFALDTLAKIAEQEGRYESIVGYRMTPQAGAAQASTGRGTRGDFYEDSFTACDRLSLPRNNKPPSPFVNLLKII